MWVGLVAPTAILAMPAPAPPSWASPGGAPVQPGRKAAFDISCERPGLLPSVPQVAFVTFSVLASPRTG